MTAASHKALASGIPGYHSIFGFADLSAGTVYRWTDGRTEGWTDRPSNRWMDGRTDGRTDG